MAPFYIVLRFCFVFSPSLFKTQPHCQHFVAAAQQQQLKRMKSKRQLVILPDGLSDDIRFICAAVQLQPHAYILTNDLFRDHMFQVSKVKGGHLFDRWRRGHCIQYDFDYRSRFSTPTLRTFWPPKHDNVAQMTETAWHLPCVNNTWLCCAFADQIIG
eukprot:m.200920 g.200920  ORF g.200920 m.200920 type:complete len:158 (-) comp16861_c1_seq6:1541-2014(-)